MLSVAEVRAVLEHSGAAAVVVGHQFAGAPALAGAARIRLRVAVAGAIPGFEAYEDLVAGHPTTLPADRSFGSPISYSSGISGQPKAIARASIPADPSVIADRMKLFCRAFQFKPLEGVHLVSAGMHHGGCQGFYHGALNAGQALACPAAHRPPPSRHGLHGADPLRQAAAPA
jgi:long-chain acyl-CoA synthetase